jgi:hypothetical protein
MLMKPRRWLAYNIEVNDLLPQYSEIVDRFEQSDIPLDGAFGSNTEWGSEVPGLLVAVGPAVEPKRLLDIVALLDGLGQLFVTINHEGEHSKVIAIGALNLKREPIAAITEDMIATLSRPNATSHSMIEAIKSAPKVAVVR